MGYVLSVGCHPRPNQLLVAHIHWRHRCRFKLLSGYLVCKILRCDFKCWWINASGWSLHHIKLLESREARHGWGLIVQLLDPCALEAWWLLMRPGCYLTDAHLSDWRVKRPRFCLSCRLLLKIGGQARRRSVLMVAPTWWHRGLVKADRNELLPLLQLRGCIEKWPFVALLLTDNDVSTLALIEQLLDPFSQVLFRYIHWRIFFERCSSNGLFARVWLIKLIFMLVHDWLRGLWHF